MTAPETVYKYRAMVHNWVDGDTVDLLVDLGFRTKMEDRFRLYGINTPEMRPHKVDFSSAEARQGAIKLAEAARDYAAKLAPVGSYVMIETIKDAQEKFGRFLAVIYVASHKESVNDLLLQKGHAKPY
jgi:micrococcal nuclease